MLVLLLTFIKFSSVKKRIVKIFGYIYFRILNISMFPTLAICLIVFELEYKGLLQDEVLTQAIHDAYLAILVIFNLLQVGFLIYSIFATSNSVFLITTSIDNKSTVPARFYQALLTLRKLLFAILIVYGRNIDQLITFSLLLLCQVVWLIYLMICSPLKYRFANIACLVNEIALAVLLIWTLLKDLNLLERGRFYVYIQIMLHFPIGTIFITLYFLLRNTCNICCSKL